MKSTHKFIILLSIIILSAFFIRATQQEPTIQNAATKTIKSLKNVSDNYEIKAVSMPSDLEFAGERVPLEIQDVYERMDRELHVNTYWQSNTLIYAKRANKYFPIIEKILAENGVPDDFKYLALIESGLMNVTSPAGAKGFWQIMKTTGKEMGLEINKNVDERYHLEKATKIACKYLLKAHDKFGNWTTAAASYNSGRSGIIRQMDKQKVNSYYDLLLGEETSRYVFRIIAAKEILSNPNKYGFVYNSSDLYKHIETYNVEVDSVITNIANFANYYGINYKEFKALNPWLRENTLNNASKKKYLISLPRN
ncbi:MAG TPA: lytic transglycosylase domain-containing protein [Flavobacteriaceae bacterium]|nr:lytic transglycosylase domain-containing protein [Flavobacteriaceae bacterium]HIP26660.1 lytic transglycosylase domain-containing protein [Flavobacteriaceae bacterium]